ncbi:MAG: adenylosuccinate synthetase [Candidatus Micrarchaeia archaeon]
MARIVLVGGQYGDEGKGKIISHIALNDKPEIVARGGVGPNAGHEVWYKGKRYPMRMLSGGFVYEKAKIMIGAGVLVNPEVFLKEVEALEVEGRAFIDKRCTIITKEQIDEDSKSENSAKIGTTKTGCGPAMKERVSRTAKLAQEFSELKKYLVDVPAEVHNSKNVLVEGSQGFMLSNLYGTYPFVTSKDVSASTIAADVGLGPKDIKHVIMVIKSYTTRVGNGPFNGEISKEEAEKLGYQEFGTVTGRPRRISKDLHFDDLRLSAQINSADIIALTKLDVKFPANKGIKSFSHLTTQAKQFIQLVEKELNVPVGLIGTGKDAEEIIDRREELNLL